MVLLSVLLSDMSLLGAVEKGDVRRLGATPADRVGIPVRPVKGARGRIGAVSNTPRRSDRAR
ncbi:hypothetical protein GCM10010282_23010 [Streptomyces roseolus]|nr:hypothetical protein GCM10010282_23010 [Streptomyces roseolus]